MVARRAQGVPSVHWSDERLVKECLNGDQDAWRSLIDKYKNLIYSIPVKYGMSQEDASEIFQHVCLGLVAELPNLREPKSLMAWLIKVTSHECSRWSRREQRYRPLESEAAEPDSNPPAEAAVSMLLELEQEQMVREAILKLAPRCQQLIRMLFFETPTLAYDDVAKNLGLAKGSIGFIRMRCLGRLRRLLEKRGFR